MKIKIVDHKEYVFDAIRKKWLLLTPEEKVRQYFILFLLQRKKYPQSLLAIEKQIIVGELKKRCDIVVFKESFPWLIVECKAETEILNDAVIQQVLRYNIPLQAPYFCITNLNEIFVWKIENNKAILIEELPVWNEI